MPTDKKPTHRLGRNAVLVLVAALAFTTVGLSAAGLANAGGNGQQVQVNVPLGLVVNFLMPKDLHVYAKGTSHHGTEACTELEKLAETDHGTTYGKPEATPWWWKGPIEFTIVGTVSDIPQGPQYEVASRASATIDERSLFTDVVKFEQVNTPWYGGAVEPKLSFLRIAWEQGTKVCK